MKKGKSIKLLTILFAVPLLVLSTGCVVIHFERGMTNTDEGLTPSASNIPDRNFNPVDPDWELPTYDVVTSPLPDFAAVVDVVKPHVVAIQTSRGAGSGWIIDEDGIIVTNNHVIANSSNVRVALFDGRTYVAV